ncbi:MAG: leucine-rich repeat domain-containing protein [Bacilli bacterium]
MEYYTLNNGHLVIKEGTKMIKTRAFMLQNIKTVKLPSTLERIEDFAFLGNDLEEIELPDKLIYIGKSAFTSNNIKSIKFNKNVEVIEEKAFMCNKIDYLTLPENLKTVGNMCFFGNKVKEVYLNDSLYSFESSSFDSDSNLYYKGIKYDELFDLTLGFQNIMKYDKAKKLLNNISEDDEKILVILPNENSAIKSFVHNRGHVSEVIDQVTKNIEIDNTLKPYEFLDLKNKLFKNIVKCCFIFGVFNNGNSKETVLNIFKNLELEAIDLIFNNMVLKDYNKKFQSVLLDAIYKEDRKVLENAANYYNNFSNINKNIIKIREEEIRKLTNYIKIPNINNEDEILGLDILKKNKKNISLTDVDNFLIKTTFKIDERCVNLHQITNTLARYIDQEGFDKLEKIYLEGTKINDTEYFENIGEEENDFYFKWLENTNPTNFILGYKANCCAKLNSKGEDIMIQSVINPRIKNLVIFNKNNIIAKSTAFYNNDYILFNNIEVSKSFKGSRESILEAILRGVESQIDAMKNKDIPISEVRIGMRRNDLKEVIIDYGYQIIKDELLNNYKFKNYEGDANNKEDGQALILTK